MSAYADDLRTLFGRQLRWKCLPNGRQRDCSPTHGPDKYDPSRRMATMDPRPQASREEAHGVAKVYPCWLSGKEFSGRSSSIIFDPH